MKFPIIIYDEFSNISYKNMSTVQKSVEVQVVNAALMSNPEITLRIEIR